MTFQDILNSKTLPTHYSNYYKQLSEPKIVKQGNKNIVTAKVQWNGKDYEFTWITTLANEKDILGRLDLKINAMLALAVRYKLGEKTTRIEYNPLTNAIERYNDGTKLKPSHVDFEAQLKKISSKIDAIKADNSQADKLKALQTRLKVINWTSNIFKTLKKMDDSTDLLEKLEPVQAEKPADNKKSSKKKPSANTEVLEQLGAAKDENTTNGKNKAPQNNQHKKADPAPTYTTKLAPKKTSTH